jgi:hypothetical protein
MRSSLALTVAFVGACAFSPELAFAKKKGGGAKGEAPSQRAMGELGGKFKWGMSPEDCEKVIGDQLHEKYAEQIKKEIDTYR